MKQIKVKTKRMRQNVKDIMREEVEEILNTMDFTNYEIQVHYDEKTNTTIIPSLSRKSYQISDFHEYGQTNVQRRHHR